MNIGKIDNVNFNAKTIDFRLSTKDGRALSESVREYAKTSSEQAKMRAFNVFDKYMVEAADAQSKETGCIYEDFLQKLRLKFFESMEYHKNDGKRISIGITENMRRAVLSDDDMPLDKLADGLFKLGKITKKEDICASKNIPSEVDKMVSNEEIQSSLDNDNFMHRLGNSVFKMYLEGYSIGEIADKFGVYRDRIKIILERTKMEYALKHNLNNIKDKICDKLKWVLLNNGCETSSDGKIINTDSFLKSRKFYVQRMYSVVKDIADGKSFDETRKSNGEMSYNMYKSLITVINHLEKKSHE